LQFEKLDLNVTVEIDLESFSEQLRLNMNLTLKTLEQIFLSEPTMGSRTLFVIEKFLLSYFRFHFSERENNEYVCNSFLL
jgi:hypothetical protein